MPPGPIFFATNKQSCMVTFVQKNQLSMPGILIAGIGHGGTAGRPHVTLLNWRVSGLHGYLLTNWISDREGASGMEPAQCNPVEGFFLCYRTFRPLILVAVDASFRSLRQVGWLKWITESPFHEITASSKVRVPICFQP